jgi:CPA2 family monovalent cation:H+ antiporter-2
VLNDNKLLETTAGHVAVGWLIVEDLFTVIVLVLIPALGVSASPGAHGGGGAVAATTSLWVALPVALLKLAALVALLLWGGARVIPWVMVRVARLRSRELFTLTVLVMAVAIAAGSAQLFGASMALGAFLAGMVVGQSPVSHQAAADALPLRDAFAVLFFTSVGMLFDPMFVVHRPVLTLAGLGIVLVGKPLAALGIVALIGYPPRTALVVALGLAQIGEFSFILSELGRQHGLLGQEGHNLLVACALVSISLNPLLFRLLDPLERRLRAWPAAWRFLNRKADRRSSAMNDRAGELLGRSETPVAVIVGYGPVGRAVDEILRERCGTRGNDGGGNDDGGGGGLETVVVDLNMDTVQALTRAGRAAIYGDAFNIEVMHQALPRATHLIITLPHHSPNRNPLIAAAKLINPAMKVFVRARYLAEREELIQVGADAVVYEEAEAAVALTRALLSERGADEDTIRGETLRIRRQFKAPAWR